ncbi:unnamed protein product, partial [Iphiclides podalirius]
MPVSDPKLYSRSCSIQQSIESSFRSALSTSKDLALQSIPTGSNRQPMQSIENVLQNVSSTIKFSDPKLHSRSCSVQQSIESSFRSAPSTSKECTRTKRRIYKATTLEDKILRKTVAAARIKLSKYKNIIEKQAASIKATKNILTNQKVLKALDNLPNSENHIKPSQINKMKVKYATQIFSQTIAANMGYLSDKGVIPSECKETADLLLFFDNIFDSLNGSFEKKHLHAKPALGP